MVESHQAQKPIDQQQEVLRQIHVVAEGTKRIEERITKAEKEPDGIGDLFLEFLFSKAASSNQSSDRGRWRKDLIAAIYQDGVNGNEGNSTPSVSNERQQAVQSTLLERLRYPGMEDREERIAVAFKNTFRWIFEDQKPEDKQWSNFKEWLESDAQLYWITGKAGSGKSTLMKFICHKELSGTSSERLEVHPQPHCDKHLQKWAAGSRLITASFFFWSAGIDLQRSQKGLLLSLLFQILEQCPELWPFVSPSRWEALCLLNEDPQEWTEQELRQMLRAATQHYRFEALSDGRWLR